MAPRFTVLSAAAPDAGGASGRPPELDELTLERAQRRDERACRALVERYQATVFQALGRVMGRHRPRGLGSTTLADLAQETFLRVFRQLPTFVMGGSARLSTWIVTIAIRVAIDELRRRWPERLSDQEPPAVLIARTRADEETRGRDAVAAVERALCDLPADWRAVLLLRIEHELEYEDIARALGIELGTVRSRLARARAALWDALAELREEP